MLLLDWTRLNENEKKKKKELIIVISKLYIDIRWLAGCQIFALYSTVVFMVLMRAECMWQAISSRSKTALQVIEKHLNSMKSWKLNLCRIMNIPIQSDPPNSIKSKYNAIDLWYIQSKYLKNLGHLWLGYIWTKQNSGILEVHKVSAHFWDFKWLFHIQNIRISDGHFGM